MVFMVRAEKKKMNVSKFCMNISFGNVLIWAKRPLDFVSFLGSQPTRFNALKSDVQLLSIYLDPIL